MIRGMFLGWLDLMKVVAGMEDAAIDAGQGRVLSLTRVSLRLATQPTRTLLRGEAGGK